MSDFENNSSESELGDSDIELQEALAHGALKPGLNKIETKKQFVNDTKALRQKQKSLSLNYPWVETLVSVNTPADMAPEMELRLSEQSERRQNQMKNNRKLPQFDASEDPVVNDFKRELLFQRQAQAAVLESVPKLKSLNVPIVRPDDYFAEMAKTDAHMQKIREKLLREQAGRRRSERVKELRLQRKEGKALQTRARLDRQKEKREMLNQVKRVRKGLSRDTSFLEGNKKGTMDKRKAKDKKFGFGGRKRGSKGNSKESSADIGEFNGKAGRGKGVKGKRGKVGGGSKVRLGKSRRMKNKAKGKK